MLRRRRTEQDELLVRPEYPPANAPPPVRPVRRVPPPRGAAPPVPDSPRKRRRRQPPGVKRSLAVLAASALAIYLVIPILWSANRLRPLAEETLGRALGRTVRIGSLRFTPGFGGIVATDVRVSEDLAFGSSDFARADQITLGVARLPLLLDGRLEIASAELVAPRLTLLRNAAGRWNFHSLLTGGSSLSAAGPELRIRDGVLTIRHSERSEPFTLRHLRAAFPHFSGSVEMTFQLSSDVDGGGTLQLNGKAGPVVWNRGEPALPMSVLANTTKLALGGSGLGAGVARALDGTLNLDATIESDGIALRVGGNAQIAGLKLAGGAPPAPVPVPLVFLVRHDLAANRGRIERCDLRLGEGSAELAGEYAFAGGETTAKLALAARGAAAPPFGRLLGAAGMPLPDAAKIEGGVVFLDVAIEGPLNGPSVAGTVTANNVTLTGFDLAEKLAGVSGLDSLHIGRDLDIGTLTAKFATRPGGVGVESIEVELPEVGRMSGSGLIAEGALDFRISALRGGNNARPIPFMVRGACRSPIFRQPGKI